jgi:hypothetical protein
VFDPEIYSSVFIRAAELIGGMDRLAAHLGVSQEVLGGWASGNVEPPPEMFLRAVDVHVEYSLKGLITSVARGRASGSGTPQTGS